MVKLVTEKPPTRGDYADWIESIAKDLALTKQRVTSLENRVLELEDLIRVLDPKQHYFSMLCRAHDGTAIASISAVPQKGIIMVTPLVPLNMHTPPLKFLKNYLDRRCREGVLRYYVLGKDALRRINIEADPSNDTIIRDIIEKARWALSKMYANQLAVSVK